jgi:hypothetical protein
MCASRREPWRFWQSKRDSSDIPGSTSRRPGSPALRVPARRFAQEQRRPPKKRGGRYKGNVKGAGQSAPFLREGMQNDTANAGRKASGLPGKRRRERLSYIFVRNARMTASRRACARGHDISRPCEGKAPIGRLAFPGWRGEHGRASPVGKRREQAPALHMTALRVVRGNARHAAKNVWRVRQSQNQRDLPARRALREGRQNDPQMRAEKPQAFPANVAGNA